jgi:hypothetical protein
MDPQLQRASIVAKYLGRKLTRKEVEYVNRKYAEYQKKNEINRFTHLAVLEVIADNINDDPELKKCNIHEYQKKELEKKKLVEKKGYPVSLQTAFGFENPVDVLKYFNPGANLRHAYILLDRRYHKRIHDESKFSWGISYDTKASANTSLKTSVPLQSIVGAKIYQFRFPNIDDILTFPRRLSINIEELTNAAFTAPGSGRKFQFLMEVQQETTGLKPYAVNDVGENVMKFWFPNSVNFLEEITITFGNPFNIITLNPDILPATISASGAQTLLTFSQPHFTAVGERIIIETFTTTQPITDAVEIELMNNENGWEITGATATTLTIDVDISAISGTVANNPHKIYIESQRFVIPIELYYMIE